MISKINCIPLNTPELATLAKEVGLPKIVIAAKVSLWQEKYSEILNKEITRLPTAEELNTDDIDISRENAESAEEFIKNKYNELQNTQEEIDIYDDVESEDLSSLFSAQEGIELNTSIEQERRVLKRILPKSIAVDLNDSYLTVLDNGRIAVGYFKSGMVYLTNYGPKGTAYHEAFHAIFRTSLTKNQQAEIYKEAYNRFGKPSKEAIANLILQNKVNRTIAEKLYYEELLADEFASYMNDPQSHEFYEEYPKGILGFFKKLLSWIKNVFSSESITKKLFNSINAGNFVDFTEKIESDIAYNTLSTKQIENLIMLFDSKNLNNIEIATQILKGTNLPQQDILNLFGKYFNPIFNLINDKDFVKYKENWKKVENILQNIGYSEEEAKNKVRYIMDNDLYFENQFDINSNIAFSTVENPKITKEQQKLLDRSVDTIEQLGFTNSELREITQQLAFLATFNITDISNINNIDFKELGKRLRSQGKFHKEQGNKEMELRFIKIFNNLNLFEDKVKSYINSLGINLEEDFEEDEDGNLVPLPADEQSDKKAATANTKLLVALTPKYKSFDFETQRGVPDTNTYLGLPIYEDYATTWNKLKAKLSGIVPANINGQFYDSLDLMVDAIKELTKYNPSYGSIIRRLVGASEIVQNQFIQTFSSTKINQIDTLVSGEPGNMQVKFANSNTNTKPDSIYKNWGYEFTKAVGTLQGTNYFYDKNKLANLFEEFKNFSGKLATFLIENKNNLKNAENDYEIAKLELQKVLLGFGVDIDMKAINFAIDQETEFNEKPYKGLMKIQSRLNAITQKFNGLSGAISTNQTHNLLLNEQTLFKDLFAEAQANFINSPGEQQVSGPKGNKKYIYQQYSSISKRISEWQSGDREFLNLLRESPYHKNSVWLNYILDKENEGDSTQKRLDNFQLDAYNNYKEEGRGDQGDKASDLKLPDQLNDVINKYLNGIFVGLAEADKSQQLYFTGMPLLSSGWGLNNKNEVSPQNNNTKVVQVLKGYLVDDINRMRMTWNHLYGTEEQRIPLNRMVKDYHYKDTPGDNKGNWNRSYVFPRMDLKAYGFLDENGKPNIVLPAIIDDPKVNKYIEEQFLAVLKQDIIIATEYGIIKHSNGTYSNNTISSQFFKKDGYGKIKYANVVEAIADYTFNSIVANIEQMKLFNGDPAFYKFKGDEFGDLRKRIPAAIAQGLSFRSFKEKNSDIWAVRPIYTSAVMQNIVLPSNYFNNPENIKRISEVTSMSVSELEDLFSPYREDLEATKKGKDSGVNVTDAQAWITLNLFKERLRGLGKWSEDHEIQFKKLQNGEILGLDKLKLFAQPLKTVHFELVFMNGMLVPVYNKQSEAVLLPQLVKGTPMENILNAMIDQNTDHLIVVDGRKSGTVSEAKVLDENKNILPSNEIKFNNLNLSYKNLFLQQDLPTKKVHDTQVASQIQKNMMLLVTAQRLYENGVIGRDIVNEIHSVVGQLSDIGVEELHQKIGYNPVTKQFDEEVFYQSWIDEFEGDVSDNVLEGFLKKLPLDAFPQIRSKIENKFNATVTKKTVKLKQSGGAFIQMSGFGFIGKKLDETLPSGNSILWIKPIEDFLKPMHIGEDNTVKRAQILLPHTEMVKIFEDLQIDWRNMPQNELIKYIDPKILQGISYRIPNQGASSNDAFEIVGILPPEWGDTMIAFNEITTKTGSDFDIDKAYVILPNFRAKFNWTGIFKDLKGLLPESLSNIKLSIEDIVALREKANETFNYEKFPELYKSKLLAQEIIDIYDTNITELKRNNFKGIEYVKYNPEKPTKAGLQNRRIELYEMILLHPEAYLSLMAPLDDDTIIKDFIMELFKEEKSNLDLNFWSGTNQLKTKSTFDTAKSLVGTIANHMVHHPMTLLDYVKWAKTGLPVSVETSEGSGKRVAAALGAFMNAIVDAAKDPYIARANINHFTASTAFMMVRSGIDPQQVIAFMGQPILREYVRLNDQMEGRIAEVKRENGKRIKPLDELVLKYGYDIRSGSLFKNKFGATFAKNNPTEYAKYLERTKNKKDLVDFIKFNNFIVENPTMVGNINYNFEKSEFNLNQLVVLDEFLKLQDQAKHLNDLISASRADTKGATKNVNSAFMRNNIVRKVLSGDKNGDPIFINADKLLGARLVEGELVFDKSRMNSTYHENSVNESLRLYKGVYLNETIAIRKALNNFALKAGHTFLTDERLADDITEELYAILMSRFEGIRLSREQLKEMMYGSDKKPSLVTRVFNAKKDPKFEKNNFIQGLDKTVQYLDNPATLIFSSRTLDVDSKNDMYLSWEEVLELDRELGEDLIKYSFYASGFRQSFGAFYEHIPVSWVVSSGYSQYIKDKLNELGSDPTYFDTYVREFFQSSINNSKLVPVLSDNTYIYPIKNNEDIIITNSTIGDDYVYAYENKIPKFKEYLKFRKTFTNEETGEDIVVVKLYELAGYRVLGKEEQGVSAVYVRIPMLGNSFRQSNIRENGTDEVSMFDKNLFKLKEESQIFLNSMQLTAPTTTFTKSSEEIENLYAEDEFLQIDDYDEDDAAQRSIMCNI